MSVEFSLTNTEPMTFKVMEPRGEDSGKMPTFLEKDMVLTLVSGKWPLGDYTDCGGRHTFVFQKADGSQFSMLLDGFCCRCSLPKEAQQAFINNGEGFISICLLEVPTKEPVSQSE